MIKCSIRVIFIKTKKLFKTEDIDVNEILVPEKEPYDRKAHILYWI